MDASSNFFVQHQARLVAGGIVSLTAISAALYLVKRELDRACPRVSVAQLPKASATRNFIEAANKTAPPARRAWGLDTPPPLLSPWRPGEPGREASATHWVPSFAALQVDVPASLLVSPRAGLDDNDNGNNNNNTTRLMQTLVAAFLAARATGPDSWLLDRDVPPLAFAPAHRLFGRPAGLGAFVLGTWSRQRQLQPDRDLPPAAPQLPLCAFPSNAAAVRSSGDPDSAGAVVYWRVPAGFGAAVDGAARKCWLPWRLPAGGFQEFVVERVSPATARVTYVSAEAARLWPDGAVGAADYGKLPWFLYELHVVYAQCLLYNTLRRLRSWQK
ncbi:hypothetical protein B0T24DRAFT_684970 [Lasiosphaeria ovina]|uniref:Uncharacterized protein n=1 Tax=Lasiosphaeria ovina TaxID=92902 RepID=A0AAE0JTJ3_9PEZI|nr:hypothetical protein B0T24DRAFT_684970 [Lasiosphaeria ovina]